MRARRRKSEEGFALLFVFLMAAMVAIALYTEMPRVLFEAERAKEQLLIDRGNEYRRAIKVYVLKNQGRYPPTIDALLNTNDVHFLRKKFVDPMTGKDEWRLIHIAGNGVFPDSLTQAAPQTNLNASTTGAASGAGPGSGMGTNPGPALGTAAYGSSFNSTQTDPNAPQSQPWTLTRVRPSDMRAGGAMAGAGQAPGGDVNPDQAAQEQQPAGIQPGSLPPGTPQQGTAVGGGVMIGGIYQPGTPQQMGQGQAPGQTPYPTQNIPGMPGPYGQQMQPGMGPGGQPSGPGMISSMQPGNQGPGGAPGSGLYTPPGVSFGSQGGQSALQIINSQIRGPGGSSGSLFGGLIAGVASTSEDSGIKTLDGRSKFKEWEFIYDVRRDMMGNAATRGFQGQTQPGK